MTPLTALVLAGTRSGGDPLAAHAGVSHKALIEVGGRTMIERVVSALAALPQVTRIVVAIERPELLRDLPVDWARVEIYFGDERCLPPGDDQRNDAMAFDALIGRIDIPAANLHPIPAELGACEAAVEYAKLLGEIGALDLVLLGLGEDGHTASLFPGNAATDSADAVVAVFGAPKPPPERVSLGISALNAATDKLFIVAGAGKRDALQHLIQTPAGRIIGAEWHLDLAAWPN